MFRRPLLVSLPLTTALCRYQRLKLAYSKWRYSSVSSPKPVSLNSQRYVHIVLVPVGHVCRPHTVNVPVCPEADEAVDRQLAQVTS